VLTYCVGDADGLGETRKKELVKSGLQLGIGNKDDIHVIEDKSVLRRNHRSELIVSKELP